MTDLAQRPGRAGRQHPLRVGFFSVVPSPYQRDLFAALAARAEVNLEVFYLEHASPDSPWPEKALAPCERVLSGFWFALGSARCHVNWTLPRLASFDVVVLNNLMSITAQRLMRLQLRRKRWLFWGERLRRGARWHQWLSAPLHRATGIVGIGSVAEADYRERFPEPRHFNLPYHCDLTAFLEQPRRTPDDKVVFLLCGQMIARKGVDVVLKAFAELPASARLLLVGREAELPEMLGSIPQEVRARVEYAGFQAPDALPAFFARADVFVLPSRYDGWGVVVNQALGAGLPILCSDAVGAAFDLVEPGVNGLRFPAGSVAATRDAMLRMVNEPHTIVEWGSASRRRAAEWQPAAGAEKWVQILQSIAPAAA